MSYQSLDAVALSRAASQAAASAGVTGVNVPVVRQVMAELAARTIPPCWTA